LAGNFARDWTIGTELTDEQWDTIKDLIPEPPPNPKGGRRPVPVRPCLEGIIWILRTGAQWKKLPRDFPSSATCWRRLQQWAADGTLVNVFRELAWDLHLEGGLDWSEGAGDATFVPAVKGGTTSASRKSEKAPRSKRSPRVAACPLV